VHRPCTQILLSAAAALHDLLPPPRARQRTYTLSATRAEQRRRRTAQLYGPARIIAVDVDRNRVEQAKRFGATDSVVSTDADWKDQVMALTDGLGVDVAIEAVGIPETFAMVLDIVRPAGHVANAGVHGRGVDLPLDKLWISIITITTGLMNTNTTGTLLKLVAQKKLPVDQFVSHTFDLHDIEKAYDTFSRAADTKALKVMLNA
jgi:alcohol dehydrogenase